MREFTIQIMGCTPEERIAEENSTKDETGSFK
jgi:hypothetical protein